MNSFLLFEIDSIYFFGTEMPSTHVQRTLQCTYYEAVMVHKQHFLCLHFSTFKIIILEVIHAFSDSNYEA